jgi:hypothetical protein
MKKRVADMAGIFAGKIKVYLNNERLSIKRFKDYVDYYLHDVHDVLKIYDPAMV